MLFMRLQDGAFDLHTAKMVSQRILDWDNKHPQLDNETRQKLHYIVQPTLDKDQHAQAIRQLCLQLKDTLVIHDDKGNCLRFYEDVANHRIYFGDEAGFLEALALNPN